MIDGIFDSVDTDEEYRKELLELKAKFGNQYLYDELILVDPESAENMQPSNWKRIIRALEVYHLTGQRIGVHQQRYKREVDYNFVQYGLNWDRKVLYRNIENRVDEMIKSGLVEEAKEIIANGYDKKLNSLNTVGYKEIISYLEGEISLDRAIELIKRNTRRFAKRQMTWFRRDKRIRWYDVSDVADLNKVSDKIVKQEFS